MVVNVYNIAMYKEWVLDVTLSTPCFVPYDRKNDVHILGMSTISTRCPGKLVGVIHGDGDKALERWIEDNPDWNETYKEKE